MENVKLILDLIRIMEAAGMAVAHWTKTASPDAVKALIAEAHARGETIDMVAVNAAYDRAKAAGQKLQDAIDAAAAPT